MTSKHQTPVGRHSAVRNPHPGVALALIAAAELMVVLDNTIVNIALPSIQTALGIPAGSLAWVVNAYALAFGGLLLLGGRSGDLYGRRRMFRIGVTLFVGASVLGGVANSEHWLIAARALQGVGGSIAAPTALSLIAVNFQQGKPRNGRWALRRDGWAGGHSRPAVGRGTHRIP